MGIKDYLKYINQEYPNAKSRIYDYVYMDCNYACHYLIYRCKSDTDLYSKIYEYWDLFSSIVSINKEIHLIFDGEYDDTEDSKSNPKYQTHLLRASAKEKSKSDSYDSQPIYPKSKILKIFREYMIEVIERYKKINRKGFKIIINSDEINGEADIKILDTIANLNQNNILICSKDSDMILISHILCIKKSIKIDIMINFRPIKFIDIEQFSKYKMDYAIIVLLLGNDYLPKISNVNYLKIINAYDKYIKFEKPIISNEQIDTNNLVNFIGYLISCSDKKIKFKFDKINLSRFGIYYNNLLWCLNHYKALSNSNKYIQEKISHDLETNKISVRLKHCIDIYNFINHNYEN